MFIYTKPTAAPCANPAGGERHGIRTDSGTTGSPDVWRQTVRSVRIQDQHVTGRHVVLSFVRLDDEAALQDVDRHETGGGMLGQMAVGVE